MRVYGSLPAAVLLIASWAAPVRAASGPDGLMARARRDGTVRVLARLPVAPPALALRGTPAGDRQRRIAIRSARAGLESALGETAWEVTHTYDNVPYVALEVGPDALLRLQVTDRATQVFEDRLEKILLRESGPIVQSDVAYEMGYDGTGWTVAVLDTGVDGTHPFLEGKVVSEACYSANGSCPNGATEQVGAGAGAPCTFADACIHGTHVAGVVAGDGESVEGIARGANVISLQVFSEFTGSTCDDDLEDPCAKTFTSDTIKALDRVYTLRNDFRIAAVNMSLGGGQYSSVAACDQEDQARKEIIDELRAVGIATVVASGNESRTDALAAPACISSAISVGATNDSDQVAIFSNSAPFLDLLAPGVTIFSSVSGENGANISGTSQASPHVAGAFAILNQRLGAQNVDEVLGALVSTGLPVLDTRNGITKPRIRILDAVLSLPGGPATSSGLQITPDGKRTLVSKDVGAERWAITLNADDGSVTGNVFESDGGAPSFVWCEHLFDDGNPDPYEREVTFACSGASACPGPSCPAGQWTVLSQVPLPGSFFLPPLSAAGVTASTGRPTGVLIDAPSGLQVTPDQKHTLVSKDVGDDRWAITLNADDGTVTGNVYTPGEEPTFLWCDRISDDGNPDPANVLLTYDCHSAERCEIGPCSPSEWSFLQEVVVPGWFFLP